MVRDSALGALLSLTIVAVVAVAFHRPDPAPGLVLSPPSSTGPAVLPSPPEAEIETPAEAPQPRPASPAVGTPIPRATRVSRSSQLPRNATREARHPPQQHDPPAPRSRNPHAPRSAFASVRAGETLADVAWRVYGDESATSTLRSANRDQLLGPESFLHEGMLLRTP